MSRLVDENGFPKDDFPTVNVEVYPSKDYTKDEVISIFIELMSVIEKMPNNHIFIDDTYRDGFKNGIKEVNEYIQEVINALRGDNA